MIPLEKYHAILCLIPFIFSHPTYTPTENSVRFTLKNIQSLAMLHHLHSYCCDPSHHQLSPGLLQSLLPSLCASAFVYWTWLEQSQSDGRPRPSSAQNLPLVSYFTQSNRQSPQPMRSYMTFSLATLSQLNQHWPLSPIFKHTWKNRSVHRLLLCLEWTSPSFPSSSFLPQMASSHRDLPWPPYLKCQHTLSNFYAHFLLNI